MTGLRNPAFNKKQVEAVRNYGEEAGRNFDFTLKFAYM